MNIILDLPKPAIPTDLNIATILFQNIPHRIIIIKVGVD